MLPMTILTILICNGNTVENDQCSLSTEVYLSTGGLIQLFCSLLPAACPSQTMLSSNKLD